MGKRSLRDVDLKNKKVLIRCDFNVPLDNEGNISDDIRIKSSLPTIKFLLSQGASLILISHLGRPKGKADEKYSLKPVQERLKNLLNLDIIFEDSPIVVDDNVKNKAKNLLPGEIMLLQNTRYRKEEEANGEDFAKDLASLGEFFINDAFGTSHRSHASNVGICKYLPSAVGFLVEKEIEIMGESLKNPKRPFVAILGGSKVSDKIAVIENLINVADEILIGGGMMFTFLKAIGFNIGSSLLEEDKIELAKDLLIKAKEKNIKLNLPIDTVVAKEFKNDTDFYTVDVDKIPDDYMGLDIGEKTIKEYCEIIKKSKTVIWNGPLGVFEMENFSKGTNSIALAVSNNKDCISIIGGGDSASAVEKAGLSNEITHISTGGGASLEFLEGKILPGIDAIDGK